MNKKIDTTNVLIGSDEIYEKYKNVSDQAKDNICFIFGAGASYGYSSEDLPYLPPIVTDLFSDKNNIVKEVINRQKHNFILGHRDFLKRALRRYNNDLEEYLSVLYNRNDSDDLFSSLLVYLEDIFYLVSDRIEENNNNYKDLINNLFTSRGKLPWSFISFNYDTFLEQSYVFAKRDRNRNFESIEDYLIYPKIIKVHGSVNFRYIIKEGSKNPIKTDKEIFELMMNGKKDIGEGINVISPKFKSTIKNKEFYNQTVILDKEGTRRGIDNYNLPLMMIPIHGTKRSENELFIKMLEEAKNEIEKSSLIIAIGYNFGDNFFLEQLGQLDLSEKELILVGTNNLVNNYVNHNAYNNALKIFKNIKVFNGNGFTDFVEAII